MTLLYPIVLETEDSGAVSAYVPGLSVYAAAETHAKTERAIRAVLTEYLNAHPDSRPNARVRVARREAEGRYCRRCRSGGRPSKRHEGARLANQWQAWWPPSRCRRRRTPARQVSLSGRQRSGSPRRLSARATHATRRSPSIWRSHPSSWFQLAKMRLISSRFARGDFAAWFSGAQASAFGLAFRARFPPAHQHPSVVIQ
jgi:hypothetical protein